ncbi:MAG TPA: M1 family metallopeptidase [Gemmatimonadales bacterium]|nr:M1 family metallopeptidase [Gemmatimonadales bacterium]
MTGLLLLLQLQASPLGLPPDTTRPKHDALHYDITVVVGDTSGHIVGQVEATWRIGSREPLVLDLDSVMRVVRILQPGGGGGRRGVWFREGNQVGVPHELGPGDTLVTRIRYHGTPRDGLVIRPNVYGVRTAFADNWPDRARRWLPSQDHPADKATVSWHVEVPAGYRAVANGVLERVDTLVRGRTVWHYRTENPIPVYTMVFGAAPFAVTPLPDAGCAVRCVPLSVWTYAQDSAKVVAGPFRRAGAMVDYFSRLIGPFPYQRLAHVESSTRFGGMENATAIFYDEKAIANGTLSEATVAHETAHQWFGDAVTEADWRHLWLSEGFATYLAALWAGYADGDSARARAMRHAAQAIFDSPATERPILDPAPPSLMALLNSKNHQKGAWVLHSLRGLVGDSAFVTALRRFYERHRDGTALSDDFARIASEAAGRDLTWYFAQALTQPGYPILDLRWRHEPGRGLVVTLRQTQPEAWGLYRLPGLVLAVDGERHRVDVEGRESVHVLRGVRRTPARVEVDPDGWWLLRVRVAR